VKTKIEKCNLFIEPPDMSQFGIFDLERAKEIFDYGYNYGLSIESEVKKLI
jgi:NTE family protein